MLGFRITLFFGNKNGSYPISKFMLVPKNNDEGKKESDLRLLYSK